MTETETIRGLERGLQVLQFLQTHPIASLGQLHAGTKLSKPSLLRILYTLERNGLVARRLGDGCYRLSAKLTRMAPRRARYDRVAEAAAPVLDHLCREISWPSDLLVPAGDHMQIAETSQTQKSFLDPRRVASDSLSAGCSARLAASISPTALRQNAKQS